MWFLSIDDIVFMFWWFLVVRGRTMSTIFHKLFEHPQGSGTCRQNFPGTSQVPGFETQGRQTFEGGHELLHPHPFAWKTPTPPSGLWTQKVNIFAFFPCLSCWCSQCFVLHCCFGMICSGLFWVAIVVLIGFLCLICLPF